MRWHNSCIGSNRNGKRTRLGRVRYLSKLLGDDRVHDCFVRPTLSELLLVSVFQNKINRLLQHFSDFVEVESALWPVVEGHSGLIEQELVDVRLAIELLIAA